jgi:hypothetical protein
MSQGSILYTIYINDTPQTPGVFLGLFADDTCIYTYARDRKKGYVLRKLQQGLSATEMWCEQRNIKIDEDRGLVFSAQGRIFNNMVYVPYIHLTRSSIFIRDNPSSCQRMLDKDYDCKSSVGK